MASMKAVKQRIDNVSSTRQIMKAMDMVAAAKLQKARVRLETTRPLYREVTRMIEHLQKSEEARENLFLKPREGKSTAYIVVTSDKGLCGGYNVNIAQAALKHMKGRRERIFVIGAKGGEYFRRREKNIARRITDLSEARLYECAAQLGEAIAPLFVSGEVGEVYIAYTHFETTLQHAPRVERLLPIPGEPQSARPDEIMRYEPSIDQFLARAIPLYLHVYLYAAIAESLACEYAARMLNMESAGKNAGDILDDLTLQFNRSRQAAITQELNEIVSGANILS
ncbi:MAG: ATP synthase F1 subunit gamma [Christensenellales bacterium]|jgi:F-type H+-transporting ATPase subunit gamma